MGKKKACITWGGWDGHTPSASCMVMQDVLEEEGYDVEVVQTLDIYTDAKFMDSIDLLVQSWTMSEITGDQAKGLSNAVMDGLGFCGWHGGLNDAFRQSTDYQFLTGSQWVAHPGGVRDYEVNISAPDDEVVKGIKDFKLKSEQYYIHLDPGILSGINGKVLATTMFHSDFETWIDKLVMPVVYKRWWGDGKIFYASFGHTFQDFSVPETVEIMRRGMRWATRSSD